MEPASFWIICTKNEFCVFQFQSIKKLSQQSNGSFKLTSHTQFSCKLFKKNSLFIYANKFDKYILSEEFCLAHHKDEICFLSTCSCHNKLSGDVEGSHQKVEATKFKYGHVDCLYTLFKYLVSGKSVVKTGELINCEHTAVCLNHLNGRLHGTPSIARKILWRKKYKKHLSLTLQKNENNTNECLCLQKELHKLKTLKLNREYWLL